MTGPVPSLPSHSAGHLEANQFTQNLGFVLI